VKEMPASLVEGHSRAAIQTINVQPLKRFSLEGQIALVSGASSGLGRHFAEVLAMAGASVICSARRLDRLVDVVEGINDAGGQARAVVMDVTDRGSVRSALDAAGAFHILVNNAGVTNTKELLDQSDEDWSRILGTNMTGAWMVAQEAARRMVANDIAGSIINVTSILASRVAGGLSPYIAAKAGLKSLTRAMALELARHRIRVNSLAPGYFMTDINADFLNGESGQKLRRRIPSRRFGNLEELDGPLLLLASGAGSYMSGAEMVVDGGHLCSSL
jgi:NAD(P)-dependent dehydrogenase (short-subunit alcohol dehydrogenase family)